VSYTSVPLFAIPFWFLRHGETVANLNGTVAGSLDAPLTPLGIAQARRSAAALQGIGITAIYSSALSRARDTADCIGRALDLPVTVIADLGERNWGEMEGRPTADRRHGMLPAGAETPAAFAARVLSGLAAIPATGVPLVVAHSGVFRVLCRTLELPEPREPVSNCQPVRFVPPAAGAPWQREFLSLPPAG